MELERTAIFDKTGRYRYQLDRRWQSKDKFGDKSGDKTVAFVMLNPSRADAAVDDPTLRACIQFAQRWDYSALSVVNLFAYRTPHPTELKAAKNPVGKENDAYVSRAAKQADKVVLAWGNWGSLYERDRAILSLLAPYKRKLTYLQLNRSGQPRHPLYIKRDQPLKPFSLEAAYPSGTQ